MPIPGQMNTLQAISAVYEFLGRPDKKVLDPSIVCTKYWMMLGKLQGQLQITDRTIYLVPVEFTVPQGVSIYVLGEQVANFGNELGFERIDSSSGAEVKTPVPVVTDQSQLASAAVMSGLAALIYRNPADGMLSMLFSGPLADTYTFRLWYEPGAFSRPGLAEYAMLPSEGWNLSIIETANACLPDLLRIYEASIYRGYAEMIQGQLIDFRKIFRLWAMKNPGAGAKKRKAYNESRRGGGGGGFNTNIPPEYPE
ncbi:MAG: hypothetical protein WBV94_21750 [Blastocatellia bacterium]